MAQERAFLKAQQQLQAMEAFVEQAADDEQRIDRVERELFNRLLAIGRTLLEAFVAAQGDGDAGAKLPMSDGRVLRRLKRKHTRRYLSIFGEILLRRWVYAQREKQRIERAPLDERLVRLGIGHLFNIEVFGVAKDVAHVDVAVWLGL